jgi:hypothetical protein
MLWLNLPMRNSHRAIGFDFRGSDYYSTFEFGISKMTFAILEIRTSRSLGWFIAWDRLAYFFRRTLGLTENLALPKTPPNPNPILTF